MSGEQSIEEIEQGLEDSYVDFVTYIYRLRQIPGQMDNVESYLQLTIDLLQEDLDNYRALLYK